MKWIVKYLFRPYISNDVTHILQFTASCYNDIVPYAKKISTYLAALDNFLDLFLYNKNINYVHELLICLTEYFACPVLACQGDY